MKFIYNSKTHVIESDDPSVFVKWISRGPDLELKFLLTLGSVKIGFVVVSAEETGRQARLDGKRIWWIDSIACQILIWDQQKNGRSELTNTYKFANKEELQKVLRILFEAVEVFDGVTAPSDPASSKAIAMYTENALMQIESGELIQ